MIQPFYLTLTQVCSHNYIKVLWNSNTGLTLDLFGFLLDKGRKLVDEGDLVYYNSRNRTEPFDQNKWCTRKQWIDCTLPVSVDGSVYGIMDSFYDDTHCGEGMFIDLFKTREEIHTILFALAVYDDDGSRTLRGINDIEVSLCRDEFSEPAMDYRINGLFDNKKVITVCCLQKHTDGLWSVNNNIIGYKDIQTLIDEVCDEQY